MAVYTDMRALFTFSTAQCFKSGEQDQIYYLDLLAFIYIFFDYIPSEESLTIYH